MKIPDIRYNSSSNEKYCEVLGSCPLYLCILEIHLNLELAKMPTFKQNTRNKLPLTTPTHHTHLGVPGRDVLIRAVILPVRVGGVSTNHVHVPGNDEREQLLARPERFGLDDGWLGDLAVPGGQPHQQFHHFFLYLGVGRGVRVSDLSLSPLTLSLFSLIRNLAVLLV